jgi:hypothetical protein
LHLGAIRGLALKPMELAWEVVLFRITTRNLTHECWYVARRVFMAEAILDPAILLMLQPTKGVHELVDGALSCPSRTC